MPFFNPTYDPANRIVRLPTVQIPAAWPKAPSQFVFILEAVNVVGAALSGADWTGGELLAVSWLESPRAQRQLARRFRPSPPIPHSLANPYQRKTDKPEPVEHLKDWQAEKLNEHWEANAKASDRLFKAVDWIAQKCRDGELTAFWRLRTGGGPLRPMNPYEWNVDTPLSTFVSEGGNKRYCRELKTAGPFETFVFFEKAQLLEVIRHEPDAPVVVSHADLSRLSPYLQLAVRVALEKGYFNEQATPKIAARAYEVAALWKDYLPGVPFSPSAAEQLARFIGFPDAQAIANGQRGGRGKKKGLTPKGQ
jgi:hypothetical protein